MSALIPDLKSENFLSNSPSYSKRKRIRLSSYSMSDSGVSSMSTSSVQELGISKGHEIVKVTAKRNDWPSLVLLTKPEELVINGSSKKRFPDPTHDRSVLLACFDSTKKMLKLRHCIKEHSINNNKAIFKQRVTDDSLYDSNCKHFISLDRIFSEEKNMNISPSPTMLVSDVREHAVAGQCLPAGVSGYWVRIFGPPSTFVLTVSLWKYISEEFYQRPCKRNREQMKIGEICIELKNTGSPMKRGGCRHRTKKVTPLSRSMVNHRNLNITDFLPTFVQRESYIQISTCLRECIDNAKYDLFEEMLQKFSSYIKTEGRDSIELQLYLKSERSQLLAIRGLFAESRQLLQHVIENVVSKSPNKVFLLNRAYLYLANVHTIEGNYGTAEECLNVLQIDKKNGTPIEDMSLFYFLRGTTLMNFGVRLPMMASGLFNESREAFHCSLSSFDNSCPLMFNHKCRVLLNMARLLMCEIFSKMEDTVFYEARIDAVRKKIATVESYGAYKISERTRSLLMLVKSELLLMEADSEAGDKMLSETEQIASKFDLQDVKLLIEKIRSAWREVQYKEFVESVTTFGVSGKVFIVNTCSSNDGDESCV